MTLSPLTTARTYGCSTVPVIPKHGYQSPSRIETYLKCGRRYFFTHVLGFKSETPNIHFASGGAHAVYQQTLREAGTWDAAAHTTAIKALDEGYRRRYPISSWSSMRTTETNKSLGRVIKIANEYFEKYAERDSQYTTIAIERPFTVLIDDDASQYNGMSPILAGIVDWIYEHNGLVTARDDKSTGGKYGYYRTTYLDSWNRSFQIDSYIHALYMLSEVLGFDRVDIAGAEVAVVMMHSDRTYTRKDGSVTRTEGKNEILPPLPVRKTPRQMLAYLGRAKRTYWNLAVDFELLAGHSPSDDSLDCFPGNSPFCQKNGCDFPELCPLSNPLERVEQWMEQPPAGFKIDHGSPLLVKEDEEQKND